MSQLSDLASFICGKVNQSETEDLTACKGFLVRRRDMIWAEQLWKDSVVEYTQVLSASGYVPTSTWLPTKKVLLQPESIERVLAVRTGVRKLNIESSDIFYRTDFDSFASSGDAYQFRHLPACVWEFDTALTLYRRALALADVAAAVIVDVFLPATNRRARVTGNALGSVDRIDGFSKGTTTGQMAIGQAFTITNQAGGGPVGVSVNSTADADFTTLADGASLSLSVNMGDTVYIAAAIPASGGQLFGEVVGGGTVTGPFGVLTYNPNSLARTFVATDPILTLAATETTAARRQRIQLLGTVPDPTTIRVLGKVKAPTFTADGDEPGLTGVENCLISFVQGDMLQRERQYGKAQLCYQEGTALLEQLKRQEVVQQAHHNRIIPEDGYGNPYDSYSHSPLSF